MKAPAPRLVRCLLAALLLAPCSATLAQDDNQVRGLVVAVSRAAIAAELDARITELPFREGEPFAAGDTLVALDCRRYKAALAAAQAAYRGARKTWQNNRELAALNSIGALEVDVSKAEADRASANVAVLRQDVGNCVVKAPFPGRVLERTARQHESVKRGDPLLAIIDDTALELELIVPATWLRWLRADARFMFDVDETGAQATARVVRMGAAIDPESQTVKVFGSLDAPPAGILAGMSGSATFSR